MEKRLSTILTEFAYKMDEKAGLSMKEYNNPNDSILPSLDEITGPTRESFYNAIGYGVEVLIAFPIYHFENIVLSCKKEKPNWYYKNRSNFVVPKDL